MKVPKTEAAIAELYATMAGIVSSQSPAVQAAVAEMVQIANDPEADSIDREMALGTIQDVLFPCEPEDLDDIEPADTFGARVQAVVDAKGITQCELAERIGVSQPAVSMLLRRGRKPQAATVTRIAVALGVPESELFCQPNKKHC